MNEKSSTTNCFDCGKDLGIPFSDRAKPMCEDCDNKNYLAFREGRLPSSYDIDEILDSDNPTYTKVSEITQNYGPPRDPKLMLECEKIIYDYAFYFDNTTPTDGHEIILGIGGGTDHIVRAIRAFKAIESSEWLNMLQGIRNVCEECGIEFPESPVDSCRGSDEVYLDDFPLAQEKVSEIEEKWPLEDIDELFIDFVKKHRNELRARKKNSSKKVLIP